MKPAAALGRLLSVGSLPAAAKAVPCSLQSHYNWLADDPAYAEQFRECGEEAIESLISEARRRATEGDDDPVFYKGKIVMLDGKPLIKHKRSDNLLMFLIKAKCPEYRDSYRQTLNIGPGAVLGERGLGERLLDEAEADHAPK